MLIDAMPQNPTLRRTRMRATPGSDDPGHNHRSTTQCLALVSEVMK
jgi:hypothetical protein